MNNFVYCHVKGCRFPLSHITKRHHCGKCHRLSHGQTECQRIYKIKALEKYYNDSLPKQQQCTIQTCIDPYSHTTDAHVCLYCWQRTGHLKNCPSISSTDIYYFNKKLQHKYFKKYMTNQSLRPNTYVSIFGPLGSLFYIRCNISTSTYEYFIMDNDSWGQYGNDANDVPKLNKFLYGYELYLGPADHTSNTFANFWTSQVANASNKYI